MGRNCNSYNGNLRRAVFPGCHGCDRGRLCDQLPRAGGRLCCVSVVTICHRVLIPCLKPPSVRRRSCWWLVSYSKSRRWWRSITISACPVFLLLPCQKEHNRFGDGAIFPAEALRGREVYCLFISQRLCVSAGVGIRDCVVEFLFYCGAGGRDWRRMGGASWWWVMGQVSRGDAEAQRVLLRVFFLSVSAPLRELAVAIASWSSCVTAAWGAGIGGG